MKEGIRMEDREQGREGEKKAVIKVFCVYHHGLSRKATAGRLEARQAKVK